MISDDEIEKALDYLRDGVEQAAQAKAFKGYLVEYRKVKLAELMGQSDAKTAAGREEFAYAHEEYKEFLVGLREAIYQDTKHGFLREAASSKIDAWRTQQSTHREMGKII